MENTIDYKKLGRRIHDLRCEKGLTQENISDAIGCVTSYMSLIENGKSKPSLLSLLGIANAIGCTVDTLLFEQYSFLSSQYDQDLYDIIHDCTPMQKKMMLSTLRGMKASF